MPKRTSRSKSVRRNSRANPKAPIVGVSWFDALIFCNAKSELAGLAPPALRPHVLRALPLPI